jgi:hypothetical protein
MEDGRESLIPDPNYNTPVKDLSYKDLLTNTFTQDIHDSGMKTWRPWYEGYSVLNWDRLCQKDVDLGYCLGRVVDNFTTVIPESRTRRIFYINKEYVLLLSVYVLVSTGLSLFT